MFISTYYRLLWAGEVAKGPHVLLTKDVHIGKNKQKFLFILWTSKTHVKSAKPQMIKITGSSGTVSSKASTSEAMNTRIHTGGRTNNIFYPFDILRKFVALDHMPNH